MGLAKVINKYIFPLALNINTFSIFHFPKLINFIHLSLRRIYLYMYI